MYLTVKLITTVIFINGLSKNLKIFFRDNAEISKKKNAYFALCFMPSKWTWVLPDDRAFWIRNSAFCEDGEVKVYVSDKAALMHLVACLLFSVSVTSTGWLFANMCLKLSLIFEICTLLYSLHYVSWTRMTIKNNELPAVTLANSYVTEAPRWAIIVYSDILSNEWHIAVTTGERSGSGE